MLAVLLFVWTLNKSVEIMWGIDDGKAYNMYRTCSTTGSKQLHRDSFVSAIQSSRVASSTDKGSLSELWPPTPLSWVQALRASVSRRPRNNSIRRDKCLGQLRTRQRRLSRCARCTMRTRNWSELTIGAFRCECPPDPIVLQWPRVVAMAVCTSRHLTSRITSAER